MIISIRRFPLKFMVTVLFVVACLTGNAQRDNSAAPSIKTFALQPDLNGASANSVNLFTGDVALPLSLISLSGHNGLNVNVAISYTSNVEKAVSSWNLESPGGMLGLGWTMDIPKITSDCKQTGAREDDDYYLMEGGVSNPLIRTTSGNDAGGDYFSYACKIHQLWVIKYYYDPVEINGSPSSPSGPNKWVITKEDGTKYVYGDKNSGRNTVQWVVRWGNWMGSSAQISGQSQMAYTWNLAEVVNIWDEHILYEYDNVDQFVGSSLGKKQTEASYLKQIIDVQGRKVKFFYNNKDPQFYAEPHTEQAEPDAYQEFYEKRYLDRVEVTNETDVKTFSVNFSYLTLNGGTNRAKMLLSSVIQHNAQGEALPGMEFQYEAAGNIGGFLKKVIYPTGGSISYTYQGKAIGRSNRQLTLTAPSGYAEPKAWMGEDYVIVAWRELGSWNTHDVNPRQVKMYMYTWVGEWKEQYLESISNISLDGDAWNREYKEFQVVLDKDFFAVLVRSSGNSFALSLWKKYRASRGVWTKTPLSTIDCGSGLPTLLSGTHFVAVATYQDDTSPSKLFIDAEDYWMQKTFDQTSAYNHFYTSANNFLISQTYKLKSSPLTNTPEFSFSYLTEDKKWITRIWPSHLRFSSDDPSYWYASNSMAVAMADNNPEYVYSWDLTYNNFFRHSKDKFNVDLFGELSDQAFPYMMSNGMTGITGRMGRFDGIQWTTSPASSGGGYYRSYGDDFLIEGQGLSTATLKVFNPNTLQWLGNQTISGLTSSTMHKEAGIDYFIIGGKFYYRQPNGSWLLKYDYNNSNTKIPFGGYPRFFVVADIYPFPIQEVRLIKNGELMSPIYLPNSKLLEMTYKFKTKSTGMETILTFPSTYGNPEDAAVITLNRIVNDQVAGIFIDYPVSSVTTNDGVNDRYTSLQYNPTTATVDPSYSTAQYNEVTVLPGNTNMAQPLNGYTKTFFFNGLTSDELGVPYMPVDNSWSGLPYETKVYDASSTLKSSAKTTFNTFTKDLYNSDAVKVNTAYYVRPTEEYKMMDGITTSIHKSYDLNTGQLREVVNFNSDSKNTISSVRYKYFWEYYDPTRALNILTPIIQTQRSLNGNVVESTAVTWKQWSTKYAEHKSYQWKKSGSADFDFLTGSISNEPGSNWLKISQVDYRDAVGNILQTSN